VVKLHVGNRPRRRTDVLPVHLEDEADEDLRRGEQAQDLAALIGEFWPSDFDEANIIRACLEAQTPKPCRVECRQSCAARMRLIMKSLDGRVFA
jgi:hypothetical protein